MRQIRKTGSSSRPLVAIAADGVSSFGRAITRGVIQYANTMRQWEIRTFMRKTFDTTFDFWPECQGAVFAGVSREARDLIIASTRHVISCSGSADPEKTWIVSVDDEAVGRMAAEHLMECRLETFAFYGEGEISAAHTVNRKRGFIAALEQRSRQCIPCPIIFPGVMLDSLSNLPHWPRLIEWLRSLPKPIGIMAVDDGAAGDLSAACRHADIAVPEEIAIVGVNNDDLTCESALVPLSSIDAGFTRIGFAAAQLLDRLMRHERVPASERWTRLPPLQVIRRLSTDILAVDNADVAQALRYIREHACDPCTVEDVLRRVPVGRRWLERAFESKLGRSPHDEILRVQMETAKRLLLQSGLTLPYIAERCGFSGAPTLGRAFLRAVGTTPAAYRRDALPRTQ